jgi:hypothetical protein
MPVILLSFTYRDLSWTDRGTNKILPAYFREWTLDLIYDFSLPTEEGAIAVNAYDSSSEEQLSVFLNWNLFPQSSETFLLSGGLRVISSSSYLKDLVGTNFINITSKNDNIYNMSVQADSVNNLNAHANGRVLPPSSNKW